MKKLLSKRVINQTTRKKQSVKMTSVILTLLFCMLTATSMHAYDWKGIDITNLSVTGDGYFEARITTNVLDQIRNQNERVSVKGIGFTLTKVELIKSNGTSIPLTMKQNGNNIQSFTFDDPNWGQKVDIDYDFSGAESGEYIRCTYTDKTNDYNCVFAYSDDWYDFTELNNSIYKDGVASNEVYIYNVNNGKFMYIGGDWGTHIELLYSDFGLKFKMKQDGDDGCYVFTSDVSTQGGGTTGEYLGMMQGYTGTDANSNGIVADKQKATIRNDKNNPKYCYSRFNVVPVEGEENTYTLSLKPGDYPQSSYEGENGYYNQIVPQNTTFYLGVKKELNETTNIEELHVVETTNSGDAAKWRFVPVSEIDAAVRSAALSVDAFNGMNLDITYKIDNQGFNRNNGNHWRENDATYVKYVKKEVSQDLYSLYLLDSPPTNGKYYYGLLNSANNGGMIYRSFTAPATGWYKVQCQGVSKSGNAYAFAKANGDEAVRAPLNKIENNLTYNLTYNEIVSDAHKQDRVKLGVDFYDNKYPVEVTMFATRKVTTERRRCVG